MVLRLHTFMFADLVGFTELTSEQGDEEAAELAISFHRRVSELARELGCHVVKAIGDAVMVRSEDGEAAVRLASRILGLARAEGLPPVRVGLDTGPAVERNGDWFGATVNTASRVTAAAGVDELLMTERTRNAAAGVRGLELTARGRHPLKGLLEQILFGEPSRPRRSARD
jgi:class 3 adenylate cyclase